MGVHRCAPALAVVAVGLVVPFDLAAQDPPAIQPAHAYVVSGYGTAGLTKTKDVPGSFFATISPIFLFQFTDRVLAESELEFELEEGATKTSLEYVDISILLNDYVTVSAGKFLLPFGVFGQRLHPTWINRFNSMPPFYGGHGGVPGVDALLPIMSDIGVMVSGVAPLGGWGRNVTFSGFVTNGPMAETGMAMAAEGPELAFGESVKDNNDNKMVGGRLGLVLSPSLELDVSGMVAHYGEAATMPNIGTSLSFKGYNLAGEYHAGRLEFRTEWLRTFTDAEMVDTLTMTSTLETIKRWGGYLQLAYKTTAWEPVFRYSFVNQDEANADARLNQFGFGLNYWITPSIAVMGAFELNRDKFAAGADLPNNRFLVHWAFGF